jgi:hypothetical protein
MAAQWLVCWGERTVRFWRRNGERGHFLQRRLAKFWRYSNPSPDGSLIIGIGISERPSQMLFLKPDLNLH